MRAPLVRRDARPCRASIAALLALVAALAAAAAPGCSENQATSNANGADVFTFRAIDSDGALPSAVTAVTVTIVPVNDPPTLAAIGAVTVAEDAPQQAVTLTGVSAGAPDEDAAQTLTFTASTSDPAIIPAPLVEHAGGTTATLRFTPAANRSGLVTVTVTATDDGGLALGGQDSVARTFTIEVTPVNDAPDALARTIGVRSVVTTSVPAVIGLLLGATDPDPGDVLSAVLVSGPTIGTLPTFSADGSFTFTPAANFHGAASFVYRALDPFGTSSTATATITASVTDSGAGSLSSSPATIQVTVANVNQAPSFDAIGNKSTNEDTALAINVTGISAGVNDPETLNLTVTTASASLSTDVLPLVTQAGCNECHVSNFQTPHLDPGSDGISASDFRSATRNVATTCGGSGEYVLDGGGDTNATNSVVPQKLGTSPPYGSRMPANGKYWTEVEIEVLRSWIRNDAPLD